MKKIFCITGLMLAMSASSAVHAQNFSLTQLITLHNLIYLPIIDTHLEKLGWKFSESYPDEGEGIDQVSWVHPQTKGGPSAAVNVIFCKQAINSCDSPEVHANGHNAQHASMVIYYPSASVYQALKQEMNRNNMAVATTVKENYISYRYTGATYIVTMEVLKKLDGTPCPIVCLQRKTPLIAK